MKITWAVLFAAACSGQGDHAGAPTQGAADAGGGGVSFGGAQDFGQFRGILDAGGIPGPDTLDANGFFNEHYAPVPANGCTDTLCMTPGLSVGKDWVTGAHQAALQIAVDTNVDPANVVQHPLNLVVVVDHSGSMASDGRLDKVKAGLDVLIDQLADTDRLAIVEFDDTAQTLAQFGATLDRPALHSIVHGLQPGGGTDIFDGLQGGFQLSAGAFANDRQNRVIFLSDGNATVGNTDQGAILAMADGYVERGIGLTTIGVGSDFDVALMKGLAEHGAGNFYFLEDPSAATEVFQQELAYFSSPIALDITLSAVAGTGYNFGEVVGSTLWAGTARGGSLHIPAAFAASRTGPAPDPGTGGRRGGGSMLFIHIDPTGNNPDGKVADLVLTYHVPGSGEVKSQTVTLQYTNDPSQTPDDPYLSQPEMAARYAMYNMYLGFRTASQQASTSYSCSLVTLRALQAAATAWNATHENLDIAADLKLVGEYMANLTAYGASTDPSLDQNTCAYTGGYGGGADGGAGWGYGDDTRYGGCYSASRGGTKATFALIGIAALWNVRRRRK